MAIVEVSAVDFPGSVLTGSGSDTLKLVGDGTFDFAYVTLSGFSAIEFDDAIVRIAGEQLAGVSTIKGTSFWGSLILTGSQIDLSGKTLVYSGFATINDDNATVTVSSMTTALKLSAWSRQGETIVLNGAVSTTTSRAELFNAGFDTIVEGSQRWTDAAPVLTGFGGGSYRLRQGESLLLDPEGDFTVSDAGGTIAFLDIKVSSSAYYYPLDNFHFGPNFTIVDGDWFGEQVLLYGTVEIGTIDSSSYDGDTARISFNPSATQAIINEFVRSIAYAPEHIDSDSTRITITARDKGGRLAEASVLVATERNWTPTEPTLNGTSVLENAAGGTVVGTLKSTDANGDPINYRLTDDAGGRFKIVGDKLVVSGTAPIDFETAQSHKVTVVANDGARDGQPSTFTVSVNDQVEVFLGGKTKDTLVAGSGRDILNGKLGNDILTGGGGADVFIFDTKPGKANTDRITYFAPKQDLLYIENRVFTKIGKVGALKKGAFFEGTKAHDANDRVIYNKKTGVLSYDPDGDGAAAAVQFAILSNKAAIKHSDIFVI